MFGVDVAEEIKLHAVQTYPQESCGFVTPAGYVRCQNIAEDPENDFEIAAAEWLRHGQVLAVVHSHIKDRHMYGPSAADMRAQEATGVPWAVVITDGTGALEPIWFGQGVPRPKLMGREFVHGVTDCYALIRDIYAAGSAQVREELDSGWPFDAPILLPDFPRNDGWWEDGEDLYVEGFPKAGFRRISAMEARTGDVFLARVRSPVVNHGGVLIDGGMVFHHVVNRVSRREPVLRWQSHIEMWLRHVG